MASETTSPVSVVIDANVVIALCSKEPDKLANAEAKMMEYASEGCNFYAPGVIIAECLYVLCRKLNDGVLTPAEHSSAVLGFITLMAAINPPPMGDKSLVKRAEEILGTFGCSRSADGIYLALAAELNAAASTELVTFDAGMPNQAAGSNLPKPVVVLPTV
ncbi:MAG TPA: PIN domain-containing protein [Gemmataceae bacterium]|nr:PIN domain-containing protein [Gemmataceae bacterium]